MLSLAVKLVLIPEWHQHLRDNQHSAAVKPRLTIALEVELHGQNQGDDLMSLAHAHAVRADTATKLLPHVDRPGEKDLLVWKMSLRPCPTLLMRGGGLPKTIEASLCSSSLSSSAPSTTFHAPARCPALMTRLHVGICEAMFLNKTVPGSSIEIFRPKKVSALLIIIIDRTLRVFKPVFDLARPAQVLHGPQEQSLSFTGLSPWPQLSKRWIGLVQGIPPVGLHVNESPSRR